MGIITIRHNEWRIRQRTFSLWALAFNAVGILLGMHVFYHKTRHWSFTLGMPMQCLFNIIYGYLLWQQGVVLLRC